MVNYKEILKELKSINSTRVLENEPLNRHTTLKVGGPADILVVPKDVESLRQVLSLTKNVKKYVIGNGSNLLISDRGIRGIVIKIAGGINNFENNGRFVTVGAGTLVQPLIKRLATLGLSGLEFAAGVPAAIGGAVVMNMGAFGSDIGSLMEYVEVISSSGRREKLSRSDLNFSYRKSNIEGCMVVSATLKLGFRQKDAVRKRINEIILKRKELQPWSVPSAGSVFRNPKEVPAGKLIDMAGLKGLRIGGAEVSKKHANFIINLGDAKEVDVRAIIGKIKSVVKEKFKVKLELELVDRSSLNVLF